MCLILDTNRYSAFLDPESEDMEPVRRWIDRGGGKIAYSPTKKMENELERHQRMKQRFVEYSRKGKFRRFPAEKVQQKADSLKALRSDDPEIVALAQVANVSLLVSDDSDLHKDFKSNVNGGKVYQYKTHRHLLRENLCP